MKLNKKIFIVLIIIVSFLFLLPNVKGFDDIEYEFEKDILFTDSNPELELFNLREQQVYNGTYNATFSFTDNDNDVIPIGWIDEGFGFTNSTIIQKLNEHKKVLMLDDQDASGTARIFTPIPLGKNAIVEFWITKDSIAENTRLDFRLIEGSTLVIFLSFRNNDIDYNDGSFKPIKDNILIANTFLHIKLVLNDTLNTFDIYVNGNIEGVGLGYRFNSTSGIDGVRMLTQLDDFGYKGYFDGIGLDFTDFENDLNFDISSETVSGVGITFEGTYYWISDTTNDMLYEYQMNGVFTGNFIDITINTPNALDLTFDVNERRFYIINDGGSFIDVYEHNGDYITTFDIDVSISSIQAITNDGNFLYIINAHDSVYQCSFEGVLTGFSFNITNEGGAQSGISFANNFFFTVDRLLEKVFQYDINGNYTGISFNTSLATDPHTITYNGSHLAITDLDTQNVYTYTFHPYTYTIGNNIIPILEILEGFEGLLETDKYEFSMLDVNLRSELGATSFGLWSFTDSGSGTTEITQDGGSDDNLDRKVEMLNGGGLGNNSILRTGFSFTNDLIDVSVGWQSTLGSDVGEFIITLNSSDGSRITAIRMKTIADIGVLSYWNSSDWISLLEGIVVFDVNFEVNIAINYNIDVIKLTLIKEGNLTGNYFFPTAFSEKNGLKEIKIESNTEGGAPPKEMEIDFVGVYRDGGAHHGELGIIIIPIGLSFHFQSHYLYSIQATGKIHDGVVEGTYVVGEGSFKNILDDITIERTYISEVETFNIYENFISTVFNATLVYTVVSSGINISSINIEGSKLIEGSNQHFLIFSSGGLESMDNYFYVSGNQLRFIHNTSIDNVLEFIQAEFDIDDKTSVNTAISFSSSISLNAFGFFRVKFVDTSQIFIIDTGLSRTKRILLSTDEVIESFIILVSDKNKNSIEGITEGQVSIIKLFDIETAIVSIVSSNLISILIPIIIIVLPTLAISGIYGDFLVVPLFILFSLMLTIAGLIPIWLSFIIFISSSLFIFFDKSKRGIN